MGHHQFCSAKLANFPKAIEIKHVIVKKGDFPHYTNVPQNWNMVIPFSDANHDIIEGKTLKEKQIFLGWHAAENLSCGGVSDFRQQMVVYCSNDVTVLRQWDLKVRDYLLNLTEIDPFESVTIAAACQKYCKTFFMKTKETAIFSTHGY